MKSVLKRILEKIGLLKTVQIFLYKRKFKRYRDRKSWTFKSNSLSLEFSTEDEYSLRWFYPRYANGKIHEPAATKVFMNYIKEDFTVLDVGANLGDFSCISAKLASRGKVYAFDVDPKCIALIKKNLKLNKLNNTEIYNYAISNNNANVKIKKLSSPNPGIVIDKVNQEDFITINSITIDDFVKNHELIPNFIKIDVEGAEGKVLEGMREVLKLENLILLVEIHVNHLARYFQTNYKSLINTLIKNNFQLERIDHRLKDGGFHKVEAESVLRGNTMLLCKKI